MSACLFVSRVDYLTDAELKDTIKTYSEWLENNPNPKWGFESDKYSGYQRTLDYCYFQLWRRSTPEFVVKLTAITKEQHDERLKVFG